MIIISFDPGKSTGFARVDFNRFQNKVDLRFVATFYSCEETIEQSALQIALADLIIIEKPPVNLRTGSDIEKVFTTLSRLIKNPELIYPASWKPIAKAQKWKCKLAKNNHEEDAYNLIRWYILKIFREDIGSE